MTKRVKKTIITGVSREGAEDAFAEYAKADAESAKITADIELQCAKIRERRPLMCFRALRRSTGMTCSARRRA